MILVFDVGNTETTVGLYEAARLRQHWRLTTVVERTPDESELLIRQMLVARDVALGAVPGTAIGSVVPAVDRPIERRVPAVLRQAGAHRRRGRGCRSASRSTSRSRLARTVSSTRWRRVACTSVTRSSWIWARRPRTTASRPMGSFWGVIAPGVRTSAETLFRRTAKLPATELYAPDKVIGTRTEDCIRAGVIFGAAARWTALCAGSSGAWPRRSQPLVVATGGLAEMIRPFCETSRSSRPI